MNFSDLQIFKAVVDEGGITRAARKLRRVPSNITMRIKQLEADVGTPLFHRSRQRLHLAPNGELLLSYATRLIDLSEEARHAVAGTSPRGLLKLGALESTAASRLPAVLAGLHRRHPDVHIELTTGTNDALVTALVERRLDAAFTAELPPAREFEHLQVFPERLVVISSIDDPPINKPRDAEGRSLIAFPNGCAYRRALHRWLKRDSLGGLRVLEMNSYHAIVACVAAGAGIAMIPETVLAAMPQVRIRRNPIPRALSDIVTPLIWRKGEISPSVLALRMLMAETTGKTRPSSRRPRETSAP